MNPEELREEAVLLLLVAADLSDIEDDPFTAAVSYTVTDDTSPHVIKTALVGIISVIMQQKDNIGDTRTTLLEAAQWLRKTL